MLQQIKPRNARSKRAFEKRAPKVRENPKTTLFLRYTRNSNILFLAMNDLYAFKQQSSIKFTKKNPIHPFEDATSLEFFSEKNDASLFLFSSCTKKRPQCLTFIRTFNYKILDMIELHLDPDTFRSMDQFKVAKPTVGTKPMIVFSGTAFDSPVMTKYTQLKSVFVDFFRGEETETIDVLTLQFIISVTVGEEGEGEQGPKVHVRFYMVKTMKSGQKVPRAEVEEMGPRMDFRIGRVKEADEDMMKLAMKRSKDGETKTKKNVETDLVGDKIGRIHLGRQDLSELQTRKMKGLKRSRDDMSTRVEVKNGKDAADEDDASEGDDATDEDDAMAMADSEEENEPFIDDHDDEEAGGVEIKKPRLQ